jgi:hypothetical protein
MVDDAPSSRPGAGGNEASDGDAETVLRGWCWASGAAISEGRSLSDDEGEAGGDDSGDEYESVEYRIPGGSGACDDCDCGGDGAGDERST